ncbi:glutamate--cysteine ligase [uncultured Limosilactobacillus sp.]|uniref:glutamate--cysteine ligase n=1 Tax=uncultured Limosilactobacillus sp. TaxID=2837629 RepID=UPI0025ECAEBF|nr:glutamate--cysteine ligase [uncultured Limosilactobacillus sp.]
MNKQELETAFHEPAFRDLLFEGKFGMRTEMHRILTNGRTSTFPYPQALGNRDNNPYLTSGYSDNLMEFNAIIVRSAKAAVRQLEILEQIVDGDLHETERLWPLSLAPTPVYLHDLERLSDSCTKQSARARYQRMTAKYGVKRALMGGVHVGYSLDEELIAKLYEKFGQHEFDCEADFRNYLYFKLGLGYYVLQWLFTYLFGASPVAPKAQPVIAPDLDHQVRSFRNGPDGFHNLPGEQVQYGSFNEYVASYSRFLEDGTYLDSGDFCGPVAFHGKTDDVRKLPQEGVQFISLRMFDLDPFSRAGISDDTLNFIELVMVYHLVKPVGEYTPEEIADARERNFAVAMQDPTEQFDWTKREATEFTDKLAAFCDEYDAPKRYRLALKFVQRRIEDPSLTICGQMVSKIDDGKLLSFGLKLSNDRFSQLVQSGKPLTVIAEGSSVSVQRLVRVAITLGIQVWINDDVEFEYGDHVEKLDPELEIEMPAGPEAYLRGMFPEVK